MMSSPDARRSPLMGGVDLDNTALIRRPDETVTRSIPAQRDGGTMVDASAPALSQQAEYDLGNTLCLIDTMAFCARFVAIMAAVGVGVYSYCTGFMLTESNLWLAATAAILGVTSLMGRHDIKDIPSANRRRNIMCFGIGLGLIVLAGACSLLVMQAMWAILIP